MAGFSVSSAERCLALLELLSGMPDGMPLSRISQQLELPQSAAHRLLTTLVQLGYVRQDPASDFYAPTLAVAAMGLRLLSNLNLPDICQPALDRLASWSGELVRLSILENDRLLWIAKAQGSRSGLRYDPITGRDVPLHTTAMGKAWLATLPEDEAVRLVHDRGFDGALVGPNAIRDEATLRTELKVTRARGFGLVREEAEAGVAAIAVIIRDGLQPGASPVAALSIAGPSFRLSDERLHGLLPMLRECGLELSRVWQVRLYQEAQGVRVA